jgi:hypothetical protein
MTLNHSTSQSGRHALKERGADLYETPACATEALLRVEPLPHDLWEPAAGKNAIVAVLRDHGHRVIASDLIDRGGLDFVADFLTVAKAPTECILTNPPYKIIGPFIRHALDLVPLVIMLAKLTFLESQERTDILEHRGLARVFVFRDRVPQMHRDGWDGKRTESNPSAFACTSGIATIAARPRFTASQPSLHHPRCSTGPQHERARAPSRSACPHAFRF